MLSELDRRFRIVELQKGDPVEIVVPILAVAFVGTRCASSVLSALSLCRVKVRILVVAINVDGLSPYVFWNCCVKLQVSRMVLPCSWV